MNINIWIFFKSQKKPPPQAPGKQGERKRRGERRGKKGGKEKEKKEGKKEGKWKGEKRLVLFYLLVLLFWLMGDGYVPLDLLQAVHTPKSSPPREHGGFGCLALLFGGRSVQYFHGSVLTPLWLGHRGGGMPFPAARFVRPEVVGFVGQISTIKETDCYIYYILILKGVWWIVDLWLLNWCD